MNAKPFNSIALLMVATTLTAFIGSGCRRETPEERVLSQLGDYAELNRTLKTQNEQLQKELSRIQSERGFPLQLQQVEDEIAPSMDLSSLFYSTFDSDWQIESLDKSLAERWPPANLEFGAKLDEVRAIARNHQTRRKTLRAALRRPSARFKIDFTQGVAADTRWLDVALILARLEAIDIADRIEQGKSNEAIDSLATIFRLAVKLGKTPLLTSRLMAVDVRRIGIEGVRKVASSGEVTVQTRTLLLGLIQDQLSLWPDEKVAWIGDRAIGLHVFEMVRGGEYSTLLPPEELQELDSQGELVDRVHVVQMNVDEDELYYLETMREVLSLCQKPYYQRQKAWDARFRQLETARDAPGFPRVAADYMLPAFLMAQQRMSRDRTRCEVWRMALQESLGQPVSRVGFNGVTGEPIQLKMQDLGAITVLGLESVDAELSPVLRPMQDN